MRSAVPSVCNNEFLPSDIQALSIALENACAAAGGLHVSDELRDQLARRIILYALAGERDPTNLYLRCIQGTEIV